MKCKPSGIRLDNISIFRPVFIILLFFIFTGLSGSFIYAASDPLDTWHMRQPLFDGVSLRGVAYGNSIFTAVAYYGEVVTSSDGVTWTLGNTGKSVHLNDITFGNSIFVAVGYDGAIITSPDGINWTERDSEITTNLSGVAYGNSMFVAVGPFGTILTSTDGITWTPRNSGTTDALEHVFFGNSTFVAAGGIGTVYTSTNGITWTKRDTGLPHGLTGGVYGNSTFVAVGHNGTIITSPDAVTWTVRASGVSFNITGITCMNSTFVAVAAASGGLPIFITSNDGVNWTSGNPLWAGFIYALSHGNNSFVAVGANGAIMTSPDGINWTSRSSKPVYNMGIAYGNSTFVAVGTYGSLGRSLNSTDGKTWNAVDLGPYVPTDITYADSIFVAVGSNGDILTSPDGVTWTARDSGTSKRLESVAYGNSTFMAVGINGTVITSPDGKSWTLKASGKTANFNGVTYGMSKWWVGTSHEEVYSSPDGVNWTLMFHGPFPGEINDITYGNSTLVAVGREPSRIFTSYDGINWTTTSKGSDPVLGFVRVAYGNSTFVAVGPDLFYTSTDGLNWSRKQKRFGYDYKLEGTAVVYGNSTFVATAGHAIFQSDPYPEITISGNTAVPGVSLVYKSGVSKTTTSDTNGNYSLTVPYGWSGTVTPTLAGYSFAPAKRSYSNITSDNKNQDYTPTIVTVMISGTVTHDSNPLQGVTISFSHDNPGTTTDENGNYSYNLPYGASTTITPSKSNYSFSPPQYTLSNIQQDKTDKDFTAAIINPVSVTITNPKDGATVSGAVTVTAETAVTSGSQGASSTSTTTPSINRVDFYIDGALVKQDTLSPYQYRWETVTLANGSHTIKAEAVNSSGQVSSDSITVTVANSTAPPHILLSYDRLNFGAVTSGGQSGAQKLYIDNSGGGVLDWTAAASESWLKVSPANGEGNSVSEVSVDPSGLAAGQYTATLTVSDANADNSPAMVDVYLLVKGPSQDTPPSGYMDTPTEGATVSGSVPVTGWAVDDIKVSAVKIYRDPVDGETGGRIHVGDAVLIEGARPDVEDQFPDHPFNYRAGWGYMMLTRGLPGQGNGTYVITAIAKDSSGHPVTLGSRTIFCDNANAVKPFGAIDSPEQGGEASGFEYINWGWALTPQPNAIATDGSTITVYVDGLPVGNPVYDNYRKDIATMFPGYANSNGAVGYFYLDTSLYGNGIHTISWQVKDNAGNTDGIGSRYFRIANTNNTNYTNDANYHSGSSSAGAGFSGAFTPITGTTGDNETITIEIKEGERVEFLAYPHSSANTGSLYSAIRLINGRQRKLPVGSTFDTRKGIFYWQPGPGFIGQYDLLFAQQSGPGASVFKKVKIIIQPKH
jgi:hypothetical protein